MIIQSVSQSTPHGAFWYSAGGNPVCVDIPAVGFRSYRDKDSAVNDIYLMGHKELARLINKAFK